MRRKHFEFALDFYINKAKQNKLPSLYKKTLNPNRTSITHSSFA